MQEINNMVILTPQLVIGDCSAKKSTKQIQTYSEK